MLDAEGRKTAVQITSEELEQIIQKTARKAVAEYAAAEEKAAKTKTYHNTFMLMKAYRDACFHVNNAVSEAEQIKAAGAETREYLRSVRKTRFKTMIMLAHVDTAIDEIKKRREEAGRAAEYTAFDMYFMQGMTYEEIAEALNAGKNTPRRWISGIINELSVLLWGIDEERL